MSIILAGDRSGTGKTTLTLALLAALKAGGHCVQSFKVGPDYIDPMFHSAITQRPCYNLDPVLTSEAYVRQSFCQHRVGADFAVIEGVMGLFDGATGTDDTASTAHVARLLELPVVLAVDCGRMARSLAALVQGYRTFDSRVKIAGVILNRVGSDRHLQLLSDALSQIDMPILGVFRREKDIELPSRHLGLVPTVEVGAFGKIAERLAEIGKRCFEWGELEPLLESGGSDFDSAQSPDFNSAQLPDFDFSQSLGFDFNQSSKKEKTASALNRPVRIKEKSVRIAIARDAAFNFYYPDNFEILAAHGADLIFWSPLQDQRLPAADGLYFGGGFPEVFAAELSANKSIRLSIRHLMERGIPTYAECGGLMYLSETLVDFAGNAWPMVGMIPQTVEMSKRLTLGYRSALALGDGPLLVNGQTAIGHEFHRSRIVETLTRPAYKTRRYWGEVEEPKHEGYQLPHLHASYVHLHWGSQPQLAERFVQSCWRYQRRLIDRD
ncbi:cobyrinate a,c-diamide synthase [cf. Phormidesmis sp. LEGE 11477]|uniref:cobyrinate a,c-diamide synthase n=1 Tax=cf. Phormidesmis sp. LEGE 11477 TaxID=1828680 RepID=UPI00187E1358|nr:cobyrinate a,c-diamide synthase [cf. Phormidesmis sp. LEGE 11477]MBE9064084.1 cobyrinate a,c-diamide synthase [cf. Phormidesmis sp. LEGE 11477]